MYKPDEKLHKEAVDEALEHLEQIAATRAPFLLMSFSKDEDGDEGVKMNGATQEAHLALFKLTIEDFLDTPVIDLDKMIILLEGLIKPNPAEAETEDGLADMAGGPPEEAPCHCLRCRAVQKREDVVRCTKS